MILSERRDREVHAAAEGAGALVASQLLQLGVSQPVQRGGGSRLLQQPGQRPLHGDGRHHVLSDGHQVRVAKDSILAQ